MTNLPKPRVSVVIPVYNSERYLREAIESALAQPGVDIEMILVDDGSNDGSCDIARSYTPVRLIEQEHQGACQARNLGLENATGEYIKFLDSDDFLEPGIITRQINFLQKADPETVVYSDILFFDEETGRSRTHSTELSVDEDQVVQLFKANIQTSAPLHRRAFLLEIGGFDERLLKAQEYNLHLRLSMAGRRFQRLPGIGTHVREHTGYHRISNQRKSQQAEENAELRRQIYLDLLQSYYGGSIPPALRRHFSSGAIEAALPRIRRGDFEGARNAFGRMMFDPTTGDLLAGAAEVLGRAARFKWRSLRARLRRRP